MNTTNDKFSKEDLINHYKSGMTIKEVAKLYNLSNETIRTRNNYYGISIWDYSPYGKLKNITKEELIEHYKLGLTIIKVAELYETYPWAISRKNKELGINIRDYDEFRVNYDVHVFDTIDSEEKAYWLGFLMADGYVRSDSNVICIKLSYVDIDHMKKFKKFMKDTRSDEDVIHIQERVAQVSGRILKFCEYQVCNSNLKQSLVNLGCIPKKSLALKFPDITKFKNPDLIYDFMRGYIDGDGCLSKSSKSSSVNPRLVISIRGTFEFLNEMIKYFPEEFKRVYSEIDKKTGSTLYKISCCSNKADKVAMKLYGNATIYLDRKFEKFAALCKLYSEKSGKNGEG